MAELINQRFDERIAAIYDEETNAHRAKKKLREELNLNPQVLHVIGPKERKTAEKLEGRSAPIGKQMLSAHFLYAIASFLLGMLIALLLVEFGPSLFANNPLFTFMAFVSPGIFIGVFVGGLRSLKPERDRINQATIEAKGENKWTLVVDTEKAQASKDDIIETIKQTL
ncbi:hypothetical protein [Alteromonas sp. W364]|jgi:uncharacterized membrane protein|uniref:hypothetical protein n=1 Tax=Alteromonas sp. W364 TaxID=3075610 RepID=UPI0028888212|nr:hypothetical protein [Alteromonas sp. W364]MDT0628030.1 hypothetical protein [Alteromonas sp. W364]